MTALAFLFFITALLYASAGFGGGSTYTALLALSDVDYRILPSISLVCNLIVVAGGTLRFAAARQVNWRAIAPWIAASIPAAWIGGRIALPESAFVAILGAALFVAGSRLLLEGDPKPGAGSLVRSVRIAIPAGAALGFLSGLVGIGGGIFLAPLLHFLRWDSPRKIAGASSLFILANSVSGLAGQTAKLAALKASAPLIEYWPLFAAVLAGGAVGSQLGAQKLPQAWLRRLTALLILYASCRLLLRWADKVWGLA